MNSDVTELLHEFDLGRPARAADIAEAERELKIEFPESYRSFLGSANGGEGPIGKESYLILWPVEELVPQNEGYRPSRNYAPDLVFIGTDGGNEVFAVRRTDGEFVSAPLIGMASDEVQRRGFSFRELLESLP